MIRRLLFAVLALLLGYGVASSKEMELGKQCDALGDAFADYSAKKSDPDMETATALCRRAQQLQRRTVLGWFEQGE